MLGQVATSQCTWRLARVGLATRLSPPSSARLGRSPYSRPNQHVSAALPLRRSRAGLGFPCDSDGQFRGNRGEADRHRRSNSRNLLTDRLSAIYVGQECRIGGCRGPIVWEGGHDDNGAPSRLLPVYALPLQSTGSHGESKSFHHLGGWARLTTNFGQLGSIFSTAPVDIGHEVCL